MTAIANIGNNATRLATVLEAGEFFYTTDTKLTYISNSSGNLGGALVNESLMNAAVGADAQIQWAYQGYLNSSPNFTYTGSRGLVVTAINGTMGGNVEANCFVGNGTGLSNVYAVGLVNNTVATINVTNSANVNGNLRTGNITIDRSAYIGNNLVISGNLQANGTSNLIGAVRVYSDLTLVGDNLGNNVGNVTAGYFKGNGALLTGIVSSYSNANVSAYLESGDYLGPLNILGNITAGGNISGTYLYGDGSNISNIPLANLANLTTNITTTGNVTANNLITNGGFYIGNTVFTRTLTVGTRTLPVTVPLASNNSFNIVGRTGNVTVLTT
jgi:cytoskeletal protein CcmA (bactofilin family)